MNHPVSEDSLKRFAAGISTRQENRTIVAHLLRGCAGCAQQIRENVRPEVPEDAYETVLSRMSGERTLRRGSWAKLLPFEKPEPTAPPEVPQRTRARR
ncbi:MAG TPA: hypothetical protein VEW48_09030 [Thermoanaerobaculia bacterium]|nr:hypothetical protein [Thermoanaerobaculia bacterium]